MAVSFMTGFEQNSIYEADVTAGGPTIVTSPARSGTYALRCNASATAPALQYTVRPAGGGSSAIYHSARFGLHVGTAPSATTSILTTAHSLRLDSTRHLVIRTVGVDRVTSANALDLASWYKIEFDCGWNAGAGARVYVDGVEWASYGSDTATAGVTCTIGVISSTTADLYFDDLVIYDTALPDLWPDWRVVLLRPISDNARGNWTGGAGGTTNLWEAINNQPPVGLTAGADSDTSQIQNATSATYPATAAQRGDFNCETYTTGGIAAGDTIRAVQAVANHGEGIVTGTKPGGLFVVSNPAQSSPGLTFDYGNDVGALGTYPFTTAGTPTRGWFTAIGPVTESPSVVLGTSPVIGVFKNVASTRETHVDFAGIYVAYSPGLPPELSGRPFGLRGQAQMHQLLSQ